MTFPVSEVSLDELVESLGSIEQEIQQRVKTELAELDARREVLLTLLSSEIVESSCKRSEETPSYSVVYPPKYRDLATGKTWSGRGKRPKWFDSERADDFLIPA